jgi:hypothetical protein
MLRVERGFFVAWEASSALWVPPRFPPPVVQALQAHDIGPGSEEVQVPVRRRSGLVTAQRLHRRRVDAPREPGTRGGVPDVV